MDVDQAPFDHLVAPLRADNEEGVMETLALFIHAEFWPAAVRCWRDVRYGWPTLDDEQRRELRTEALALVQYSGDLPHAASKLDALLTLT